MPLTPKGYTTKSEVEDYLFATLDAAYDAALDDLIAKAEAFVERRARRTFDQPAGPIIVPGSGTDVLVIPDTRSIASVTVDDYATTPLELQTEDFDYRLEPVSAPNSGRPFTRLRLLAGTTVSALSRQIGVFPDPGKVTLTGTFGWAEVPAGIRMATTILVAEATRRWRDSMSGDVSNYSLGDYSVTFSETARKSEFGEWLTPYVKPRVR